MPLGKFGNEERGRKIMAPGEECPECGKPMRVRARKSDGKGFLGCSGFPDCRHTEAEFRDAPADYKAPAKPYNPQAMAKYQKTASAGEFTEFEFKVLAELVQKAVTSNKDDIKFEILVKLERCLEKFKAKTPIKQAMEDATIDCEPVEF